MATLRKVTANTLLYSISQILQRGSSVIFFPIFSFYLTQSDYGIQSISSYISGYCFVLAGFELNRAVSRLIYEEQADGEFVKRLMGTMFLFQLIVFAFVSVVGLVIGPFALQSLLNDIPFYPYMALTFMFMPLMAVFSLYKVYLQATHQGLQFMKVDLLFWGTNVGLNLLFVIAFHLHVEGLLLSTLISCVLFAAYAFYNLYRKTKLRIDKAILTRALQFSLPILPFIVTGTFLESMDKMVLNNQSGKDAAGIYYIAVMVAGFFSVLKESAISAIQPWFYQHFDKQTQQRTREVLQSLYLVLALLVIGISWFSFEMLHLLSRNPDLVEAYKYTPFIVNALLMVLLSQLETLIVYYRKKKIKWLVFTSLLALFVNWQTATHLIPLYGITGAAISYLCAMTVLAISTAFLTRSLKFHLNYWMIGTVSVLTFGLSIFPLVTHMPYIVLLCIKLLGSVILCSLLYMYLQRKFRIKELGLQLWKEKFKS